MKQFIYLDNDIVASIIAQAEKGLITQLMSEQNDGSSEEKLKSISANLEAGGEGSFLKIIKADAKLSAEGQYAVTSGTQLSSKEVVEKILHDASFDIAYRYIKPTSVGFNDQSKDEEGNYLEIKRCFDFADFDYLEGLFEENGFIGFIKKMEKDKLDSSMEKALENYEKNQIKSAASKMKQELSKVKKYSDKQYDDIKKGLKAIRGLIPYSRMMVSNDGYLIPLDDKYFRIDPSNLGFKYGGVMTCVGMVTNIIGEDANPNNKDNMFATIQHTANETLRILLPTSQSNLCVIHPIAVYYGENKQ